MSQQQQDTFTNYREESIDKINQLESTLDEIKDSIKNTEDEISEIVKKHEESYENECTKINQNINQYQPQYFEIKRAYQQHTDDYNLLINQLKQFDFQQLENMKNDLDQIYNQCKTDIQELEQEPNKQQFDNEQNQLNNNKQLLLQINNGIENINNDIQNINPDIRDINDIQNSIKHIEDRTDVIGIQRTTIRSKHQEQKQQLEWINNQIKNLNSQKTKWYDIIQQNNTQVKSQLERQQDQVQRYTTQIQKNRMSDDQAFKDINEQYLERSMELQNVESSLKQMPDQLEQQKQLITQFEGLCRQYQNHIQQIDQKIKQVKTSHDQNIQELDRANRQILNYNQNCITNSEKYQDYLDKRIKYGEQLALEKEKYIDLLDVAIKTARDIAPQ